jgi:FixJ family two-component response regulator
VVRKCIETGARGYVPKSISLNSLSNIIRLLASGQVFLPADISLGRKRPGASEAARSITDREVLTLQLVAEGKTNKEIAYALDATEMTVKMSCARSARNWMQRIAPTRRQLPRRRASFEQSHVWRSLDYSLNFRGHGGVWISMLIM